MDRHERANYLGLGFFLGAAATLAVIGVAWLFYPPQPPARPSPRATEEAVVSPLPSLPSAPVVELPVPATPSEAPPQPEPPRPEPEWTAEDDALPDTLVAQRAQLFSKLGKFLRLSEAELADVVRIFQESSILGQGNPKVTTHPMTRAECRRIRAEGDVLPGNESICGKPFMVPVYDYQVGETEADARLCIDQFEFPNIPCEYPVTWVRGLEAAKLCKAVGKRLCDAHEWEGACAGSLRPSEREYDFRQNRRTMRLFHNQRRELIWAYGRKKHHEYCATGSRKSPDCDTISWHGCGSNTYPAGAFLECVSPFGVYDLHGNAAEHMNIPLKPDQLASRGEKLGETEMKGSWFIFKNYEAHEDDCRWRAPDWHGSRVMDAESHANYHLGFRCCREVG